MTRSRSVLLILLYGLACGAVSLGVNAVAGLTWQIIFVLPAVSGGLVLGRKLGAKLR